MGRIDKLAGRYQRFIGLPWQKDLPGAQRVVFIVYDKTDERRLRARKTRFELATQKAGQRWVECNLTTTFAEWMANHDYRDAYFEQPELMGLALGDFSDAVAEQVRQALNQTDVDEDTVVALFGLASLFGLARVAELISKVDSEIRGRLLAFFPGQRDGSNWRLLNARDGWNYHAVPI